jgi:hypothetical protein
MVYLVCRMKLTEKARRDLKGFWAWLEARERWFYRDLPMVRGVRWFPTLVGELYTLEVWAAFDDLAALGEYRKVLGTAKADDGWEAERVSQEDWWEFLDSRLVNDPPCQVGFGPMGAVAEA